jgi:hypothetical protein
VFLPWSTWQCANAASYITTQSLATEAGYLTQKRTGFVTFINAGLRSGTSQKRLHVSNKLNIRSRG